MKYKSIYLAMLAGNLGFASLVLIFWKYFNWIIADDPVINIGIGVACFISGCFLFEKSMKEYYKEILQ